MHALTKTTLLLAALAGCGGGAPAGGGAVAAPAAAAAGGAAVLTVPAHLPMDQGLSSDDEQPLPVEEPVIEGAPQPPAPTPVPGPTTPVRVRLAADGGLFAEATPCGKVDAPGLAALGEALLGLKAAGRTRVEIDAEGGAAARAVVRVLAEVRRHRPSAVTFAASMNTSFASTVDESGWAAPDPPAVVGAAALDAPAEFVGRLSLDGSGDRARLELPGAPPRSVVGNGLVSALKLLADTHRRADTPEISDAVLVIRVGAKTPAGWLSTAMMAAAQAGIWRIELEVVERAK